MSKLMSGAVVLTASRLSNFAILLVSPLLLVRILDVRTYGEYQEFMLYAILLITICEFAVNTSLTYFVPRYTNRDRALISQTSAIVLIFSSLCLSILLLARPLFIKLTSFDFVLPLAAYVFCFVNLNWLENFWIAKGRVDLVLYYSTARLIIRATVLVLVAYFTRDVEKIIWSVVATEALRLLLVAGYLLRTRALTNAFTGADILEQLRFTFPGWVAWLVQQADQSFGRLFISNALGPAALAYYSVAGYLIPIVGMVRTAPSDVLLPALVQAGGDPRNSLRLWQRSTVVFWALFLPLAMLLTCYAELFITTFFTAKLLPAVPLFEMYALWILRRCFSFDELLRSRGKTGFMMIGSVLGLAANLALTALLYHWFGFVGPAVAFIISQVASELYYAHMATREFGVTYAKLLDWRGLWQVSLGCLAGAPLLIARDYLPGPELLRAAVSSLVFVSVCWYTAFRLGVDDIGRVATFLVSRLGVGARRA
jgi:O-antigen/teichoic acid export membrane protein